MTVDHGGWDMHADLGTVQSGDMKTLATELGKVHGTWPGLSLGVDSDLLVTTDYRSVLAEVVSSRFGVSTAKVFPGFSPRPVGAVRG